MTHMRPSILQAQPKGMWGVRGGGCFSHTAQAAAGSHLLTTFCYVQAAETDFSFQLLALLLFAGCLVPEGKLWWLVLGGTAGQERSSRSIPVPPFLPPDMGLSALRSGCDKTVAEGCKHCWQVFAALSISMELSWLSFLCTQLLLLLLSMGASSLPSASGTVSHPLSLVCCGTAGRQSAQDARGSPSWHGADLAFSSPACSAMEWAVM